MSIKHAIPLGLQTFEELKRALDEIPDQTDGDPCAVAQIGEMYLAFKVTMPARPGDEKLVERWVIEEASLRLNEYLDNRGGTIYWRLRPELVVENHEVVLHRDINGPDIDYITNERCIKDKNWRRVGFYCRLVRARMPAMEKSAAPRQAA